MTKKTLNTKRQSEAKSLVGETIGTLSFTTKMPCASFSIPTLACKVGSILRETPGSVCNKCYAHRLQHRRSSLRQSLQNNLDKLSSALQSPESQETWVSAFVKILNHLGDPYFRWHDAGDLQSLEHLRMVVEVARRTPNIKHWLPTKEYKLIKDFLGSDTFPLNLIVRVSSPMLGQGPLPGFQHTSTATGKDSLPMLGHGTMCPAPSQNNQCLDCRKCWNTSVPNITYIYH